MGFYDIRLTEFTHTATLNLSVGLESRRQVYAMSRLQIANHVNSLIIFLVDFVMCFLARIEFF